MFKQFTAEQPVEANEWLSEYIKDNLLSYKHSELPPVEELNATVEDICEQFFIKFEKYPSNYNLVLLGEVILQHYSKDRAKQKMKTMDHPFLSTRQLQTRYSKEFVAEPWLIEQLHSQTFYNIAKVRWK